MGTNYWQLNSPVLSPGNSTLDVTFGGTATSSAKIAFLGLATTSPVASIAANPASGTTTGLSLNSNGSIQGLNMNSLTLGGATTGNLQFYSSSNFITSGGNLTLAGTSGINLTGTGADINFSGAGTDTITTAANQVFALMPGAGAGVGVNTTSPLSSFDIRGNSGTTSAASVSATTSFASLVVNNSGKGDLFTASSSGLTRFVVTQNGAVGIGTRTPQATYLDISENPAFAFVPTADFVDIGNAAGQEPTTSGVNALQLSWFAKPASGNTSSAQHINITNNNTTTAGQVQGMRIVSTGAGGTVNSDTDGLFIDGLTNASTGTVNQNAIEVGANWDNSIFGDGDLRINANGNIILATSSAATKIGINTTTPLATLDVRGKSGTTPVASVAGATSFAALVVNNSGTGDIFTASSSGISRFRMTNNGSTVFQGDTLTSVGSVGNNGAAVSETNQSAVVNAIGDEGSLVPNSGFESAVTANKTTNVASGPIADGWIATATMSASVTRIATDSAKGSSSVLMKLNASQSTSISSVCIPLSLKISAIYNLNFYANASTASPVVRGFIDGFTTKANCQTNTGSTPFIQGSTTVSTTGWKIYGGATAITTSGTDTWGRVRISVNCPASCASPTTVEVDGIRLIETSNAVGVDYAEDYPADPNDTPDPGDIVSMEASNGATLAVKTHVPMDQALLGVVSTNPGDVLDDGSMTGAKVPVALAGRVPVNVSTANGPIHIGDYVTSSHVPGVAIKATGAGPVIGTAMEEDIDPNTSDVTQITVFIKNTYYNGSSSDSGLMLTSGAQDASILLNFFQGMENATDSALTTLSQGQVVSGLNLLISALHNTTSATGSASSVASSSPLLQGSVGLLARLQTSNGATVSGDLRVTGNGLIEGVLHIVDTLFANNFIANGASDFFGNVIFHTGVTFTNSPTFSNDTAGSALIKKGSDHVDVTFSKAYDQLPVINVSLSVEPLTPTPGETIDAQQQRQNELEKTLLADNIHFIVTNKTVNGFTILLDKPADEDISFAWLALMVQNPIIFQSTASQQTPTPSIDLLPSPIETLMPTKAASPSAGF